MLLETNGRHAENFRHLVPHVFGWDFLVLQQVYCRLILKDATQIKQLAAFLLPVLLVFISCIPQTLWTHSAALARGS
jgi:hypothetical protein